MASRFWIGVLGALAVGGCSTSDNGVERGLQQYVVVRDGYHEFYLGEAVWDDVEATGTFTPEVTDWYTMIRVPDVLIPLDEDAGPITVSLCSAENDVFVYDHVYVGPEKAIANRPNPPDPFLSTTDAGEMISQFRSGDEGLYGLVQVRHSDEYLLAGAALEVRVYLPNGNAHDGGLLAGRITDDPAPDDPLLEHDGSWIVGCKAPPL